MTRQVTRYSRCAMLTITADIVRGPLDLSGVGVQLAGYYRDVYTRLPETAGHSRRYPVA